MSHLIVNILDSFLGEPHYHNEDSGQLQYDCPACSFNKGLTKGDGKHNLEVNYVKNKFRCWSCYDTENMGGSLPKLIKRFGTSQNLKDYELINPIYKTEEPTILTTEVISLPEGYVQLDSCDSNLPKYKEAISYLKIRNIGLDIIKKYKIGFTSVGKFANRIIIPSYNLNGDLDFFIARSFLKWGKPKYLNPEFKKTLIHFNESMINWDATIYLVEGAFDGIVCPNPIINLGKVVSEKLFYDLQYKATGLVVIVFDGDAYKDAVKLYKQLNTLNLYNRVRIVKLGEEWDLSLINQKQSRKGVYNALKTAHKIKESRI